MKLKCIKCGTEKQTNTNQRKKLVEKYGSGEALEQNYTCKKCAGKKQESVKPVAKEEQKLDVDKQFSEMERD